MHNILFCGLSLSYLDVLPLHRRILVHFCSCFLILVNLLRYLTPCICCNLFLLRLVELFVLIFNLYIAWDSWHCLLAQGAVIEDLDCFRESISFCLVAAIKLIKVQDVLICALKEKIFYSLL